MWWIYLFASDANVLKGQEEVWDGQHVIYKLEDHWHYTDAEEHTQNKTSELKCGTNVTASRYAFKHFP